MIFVILITALLDIVMTLQEEINFFSGLISTTSWVVFITARIVYIRLFNHSAYDFHIPVFTNMKKSVIGHSQE